MTKRDDISDYPRILPVRFVGRIFCQLFKSFGVHGIDLNQFQGFLPQKVKQGLCIGPGRLKANDDFFKMMVFFEFVDFFQKVLKIFLEIVKSKWLNIFSTWSPKVGVMSSFSDIQCHDHCFFIDNFDFFLFTNFHGYAPFLIFANQLATGLNQDEYSLFCLDARLTTI